MNYAKTINSLTSSNLDQIWQRERDLMQYNFQSSEDSKDRALQILLADKSLEELKESIKYSEDKGKTKFIFDLLFNAFD
jgi:hypothetical protein